MEVSFSMKFVVGIGTPVNGIRKSISSNNVMVMLYCMLYNGSNHNVKKFADILLALLVSKNM